jgi:UDP-N-acetylmuramyl tripeptide synthase
MRVVAPANGSSAHVTGTNLATTTAQKFAQFCKSGRKKRSRM